MAVSDILDDLREQFPACKLIAFADLSADMVLATSAATTMPQERWDLLCAMARDGMGPDEAGIGPPNTMIFAALVTDNETDVFLRSLAAPDFVLCAVGAPDLHVADFHDSAKDVLDQLVQHD